MTKNLATLLFTLVILLPLQVLVFRNFVIFDMGFCFVYLLFLLMLPRELSIALGMVIALATGLVVDLFYQTIGIHAAAGILVMFLKPYWQSINSPRSGYEVNDLMLIRTYGLSWYLGYATPLILVYALAVMFIEAGSAGLFGITLLKATITTLITLIFILVIQYLFYNK